MNAIGSTLGNSITEFLSRMSQQAPGSSTEQPTQPPQPEPQDRAELSAEAQRAL